MVVKTLKEKYNEFLNTFFLLIIVLWFFAGFGFFYLRDIFAKVDLDENVCSSYLRCFITYFNYGMRTMGPFDMPNHLLFTNKNFYGTFVFDWFLFFFVVLILLNMVNAVIVDSFQNFREENSKKLDELANVCYVCDLHRSDFEIRGINYYIHTEKEHNAINYVYYMISLLLKDEYDLSSTQTYIYQKMSQNQTEFIPFKKAMCLSDYL